MRLVLDTNILVSGLLSRKDPPRVLVAAWLDLRFELVASAEQLDELRRVLAYGKLSPPRRPESPACTAVDRTKHKQNSLDSCTMVV